MEMSKGDWTESEWPMNLRGSNALLVLLQLLFTSSLDCKPLVKRDHVRFTSAPLPSPGPGTEQVSFVR